MTIVCPPWRSMIARHRRRPVPSWSMAAAGGRRNIASYGISACSFAMSFLLPSVGSGRIKTVRPLVSFDPSPLPSPGGRGGRVLVLLAVILVRVELRHRERDAFVDPHGDRATRAGGRSFHGRALPGGKPPEHPVPLRHARRRGVYADPQPRVLAGAQRPLDVLQ